MIAVALVAAACAGGGDGPTEPAAPTAPPAGDGATFKECVAPAYRVSYPGTWFVNAPDRPAPCRFFHPEPFTLPDAGEATGIAISISPIPQRFDDAVPPESGGLTVTVVDRRQAQVSGSRAVRLETRATGSGLLDRGTRAVSWFVEHGGSTLVATTTGVAAAGTFDSNTRVLDRMMAALDLLAPGNQARCSAAGADRPPQQPGLPEPVARMRADIAGAALACDYAALAALALEGPSPQFTYSFGDRGDPAAYWRTAEADGRPVLRHLVQLLSTPFGTRDGAGSAQYVWPSAFAYETWEEVPAEARRALGSVYSDDDLAQFAAFGSYAGLRIGITASGDWLFFVGGD